MRPITKFHLNFFIVLCGAWLGSHLNGEIYISPADIILLAFALTYFSTQEERQE